MIDPYGVIGTLVLGAIMMAPFIADRVEEDGEKPKGKPKMDTYPTIEDETD